MALFQIDIICKHMRCHPMFVHGIILTVDVIVDFELEVSSSIHNVTIDR